VMAIAVAGLLASLSTSLRNGAKLTDSDRAATMARAKMDELMLTAKLPHNAGLAGAFDPRATGWPQSGWRAVVQPYEIPPGSGAGSYILERIRLEIWWTLNGVRRAYPLEAYRTGKMVPGDVEVRP
jgi:hypothetical protein